MDTSCSTFLARCEAVGSWGRAKKEAQVQGVLVCWLHAAPTPGPLCPGETRSVLSGSGTEHRARVASVRGIRRPAQKSCWRSAVHGRYETLSHTLKHPVRCSPEQPFGVQAASTAAAASSASACEAGRSNEFFGQLLLLLLAGLGPSMHPPLARLCRHALLGRKQRAQTDSATARAGGRQQQRRGCLSRSVREREMKTNSLPCQMGQK